MSVIIGSARIDENGKTSGGKPGDQNGREVSTQAWYLHEKGWRVLRCNERGRATKLADAMRAACANDRIGYSQVLRGLLYAQVKPFGFDPAKATTPTTTDCSALVRVCCAYAGMDLPSFNTSSEAQTLLKSGHFTELTDERYTRHPDALREGDILVTKVKGHTAVVLTSGENAEKDERVALREGTWNLRSGDGTGYAALGQLRGGEYVVLERRENGWVRVAADVEGSGWLSPKALA